MTVTVYVNGRKYDEAEKFSSIDYSGTSIDIEYEDHFERISKLLGECVGTFVDSIGTISTLFQTSLLTLVDDENEDIIFVLSSGLTMKVTFTEPDEEEEEEEEEEEDDVETKSESPLPLQDNSHAPQTLNPKREETKHVPFWKL